MKRSLVATTGSSRVLNGSGVVKLFRQIIASYYSGQHCLLWHCQTNVVNMPRLSKGERWKIVVLGTDGDWTQDELKKHF